MGAPAPSSQPLCPVAGLDAPPFRAPDLVAIDVTLAILGSRSPPSMEPVLACAATTCNARQCARAVAQTIALRPYHPQGYASNHLLPRSGHTVHGPLVPARSFHMVTMVNVEATRCSVLRATQRQRRQLTAPGSEPAVTSPFSPAKAASTSPFSRSGTLNSSRVWASSAATSSNTSGGIFRSKCASRSSLPV